VQSGKPVAVFRTFPHAPRVLIANSLLVPSWSTWQDFWELEALGLTMYGQMTAGSWIYIGTQGIVQGTFQTFAAIAEQRYDGTLRGRIVLTSGLGGMGGAQPLAVTLNGGVALCLDVDPTRVQRRVETRYLDEIADSLEDGVRRAREAAAAGRALSIGVVANAAEALPDLLARGEQFDVVTDQTSAHDPLNGYVPAGLTVEQAQALRERDPDDYLRRVGESVLSHVAAIRDLQAAGAEAFDYGNALRGLAASHGDRDAFAYPGFVPAYIRPLFCEGKGPFRWVALSGDPADIHATDAAILDLFGDQEHVARWIRLAAERVQFQGLPARICWLGYGERHLAGLRFNEMVASGELRGPVVIGRDHLDAGSVASPERETESMADGTDAVADWPLLNALINTACGASWVSIHHGGGVGMGKSIHAGQVCVADGTRRAGERIRRVLTADPGMGIVRHADAGERAAVAAAERLGVRMPMLDPEPAG
jgi:urocanate hydratase